MHISAGLNDLSRMHSINGRGTRQALLEVRGNELFFRLLTHKVLYDQRFTSVYIYNKDLQTNFFNLF